jgi:hypothetical protein
MYTTLVHITLYQMEKVENRNREISKYLRLFDNKHRDWDEVLQSDLWALRIYKNEMITYSNFEFLYMVDVIFSHLNYLLILIEDHLKKLNS